MHVPQTIVFGRFLASLPGFRGYCFDMSPASQALARMVRAIGAESLNAYGVVVRVGDDEVEHRWRSDDRVNLYSVSKGVSALAAGIAIDEGVLEEDSRVADHFPSFTFGSGAGATSFRQLLTMTSGIDFEWFGHEPIPWADLAQEMLRRPARDAGLAFQYSDASYYTAMRMLATRVGDVRDWLMPRLFEPLGIHNPQWHRCPRGAIVSGSGLELRTHELARIGRLLRDGGVWGDQRLISENWIRSMHGRWTNTGGPSFWARYGLGAWDGPHDGWRLDGLYGQYVYISEVHSAVVTITAHEEARDYRLAEIAAEGVAQIS
ncbi:MULTISPECIES: serine hydrolase domain-containing protein [unclassified Microbacterium]|uniref:serine hydrolase domain-containing protein n=1 Tax=unclassified Microbacterium TaxID=2609290 RepID=UPI00386FF515